MDEIKIIAGSKITKIEFERNFIKRKKMPKEQCGLTVITNLDLDISLGELKIGTIPIQHSFMLTADEFNEFRKGLLK